MSNVINFPFTNIGTPSFLPLLLTYVRNASTGPPIEPVIFQSILLCLIAGNKHLILRTVEDDIGLVVKLAVKTLTTVFGILTHRIRINRRADSLIQGLSASPGVSTFVRSLFIPVPGANFSQDEASTLTGHGARKYRKRPGSRSRSRSATIRSMPNQYTKSLSYPNDLLSAKSLSLAPSLSLTASEPVRDHSVPSVTGVVSPTHLNTASRNSSLSAIPQPTFPHSYSDPTPFRVVRDSTQIQLPGALVLSGLENATLASQRALTEVLTEARVVLDDPDLSGVWPLPKDFILVYVCPPDERERPPIHKSLLGKFSLSATVSLHPTFRSVAKNFFRPVSHRASPILSPSPQVANWSPNFTAPLSAQSLPHRHISPGIMTPSNGLQAVITAEAMNLLKEVYSQVRIPSTLHLYISDLFSAARHHHQMEGRLVSITAINDASELSRAARVLGGDPTGMELINDTLRVDDGRTDDNSTTGDGASDERFSKVLNDVGSAFVVIDPRMDIETQLAEAQEDSYSVRVRALPIVLDVTQADIARIVPRVLTHRLRVRDGPEDEVLASAVFGATFSAALRKEGRGRKRERNCVSVKELLIGILQEV